jgi:hypothetical protein
MRCSVGITDEWKSPAGRTAGCRLGDDFKTASEKRAVRGAFEIVF